MSEAPTAHPLAALVRAAALGGDFPPVDGRAEVLPSWREGVEGVVAFTGHGFACLSGPDRDGRLASAMAAAEVYEPGFGGLTDPRVVLALADGSDVDSLDVLLAAPGVDGPSVLGAVELDHPRVELARSLRDDVDVLVHPDVPGGVVTVSRGVGGLREVSIEVPAESQGRGAGRALAAATRAMVAPDDVVVAAVAPGNVASLRCFLAAGFAPVAAVQLWWAAPD